MLSQPTVDPCPRGVDFERGGVMARTKVAAAGVAAAPTAGCPGQACPLYMWGNFGTYCSYYALVCDTGQPVNLNLPAPPINPGGCAAPDGKNRT